MKKIKPKYRFEKLKIPLALGTALVVTFFLSNTLFIGDSPNTNRFFISTFLSSIIPKLSPHQAVPTPINFDQVPTSIPITTSLSLPTNIPVPTKKRALPILIPTINPSPTAKKTSPTSTPTPKSIACPKTSSQNYQTVQTNSDYTLGSPAETHPEINLGLRGYVEVNEKTDTVHYGGDTDPQALKINSIFTDGRKPKVAKTYKVHAWDYANNRRSNDAENAWPVSLIGLASTPGESIVVPPSGRSISGDLELMVLYADENRVTFTNSVGDNWTDGYILHVEDICTDPDLISAYQNANASGRGSLPALPRGQVFAIAKGSEVKVAIRDSGQFMDPRSDKDWW